MRLVLPFGFYGAGNTGDEATLNGFARLLALAGEPVNVWSGSRNPEHTARTEPAFNYFSTQRFDLGRWYAKYRATAYAVAGGTPIQDVLGDWPFSELTPHVRSVDRRGIPFIFIGVGIEDLQHANSRRLLAEEFAPRVRHWSVRSQRGLDRLVEYGIPKDRVSVAADMAWLIDPATHTFGLKKLQEWGADPQRPIIAVNLANENAVFDKHPEMTRSLAAALDQLIEEQHAQVLFLSADIREESGFDKAAALKVFACLKHQNWAKLAPNYYFSPQQLMSIIGCCQLTMSMRYHFCLFSALQGVPFIGIQRTDKVLDLCHDLDWPAMVVPPRFTAEEVVGHGRQLTRNTAALSTILKQKAAEMKNRALLNLKAIDTLRSH